MMKGSCCFRTKLNSNISANKKRIHLFISLQQLRTETEEHSIDAPMHSQHKKSPRLKDNGFNNMRESRLHIHKA